MYLRTIGGGKMKLYCWKCKKVHQLTEGQVERILYAMQGELSDKATVTPYDTLKEIGRAYPQGYFFCLETHLGDSYDNESYGEHTNSLVELRIAGK